MKLFAMVITHQKKRRKKNKEQQQSLNSFFEQTNKKKIVEITHLTKNACTRTEDNGDILRCISSNYMHVMLNSRFVTFSALMKLFDFFFLLISIVKQTHEPTKEKTNDKDIDNNIKIQKANEK